MPAHKNIPKILTSMAMAAALTACHTTPPKNSALVDAHQMVDQASANADVVRNAQIELDRARAALTRADLAWSANRDESETSHLAYLARQRAVLAMNLAAQRAADAQVQSATSERERARADARTREAQNAQQAVQSAQAVAQSESQRADALQRELERLSAKQTDRGMVLMLQDVLFDVGQSTLKPGALSKMDQLATVLKNYPERKLMVEGFTDSTGSDELNQALSQRRADAVRDALVVRGVSADRVQTRGHGKANPVASNGNAAGRQQNRRVEVVFSDAAGVFAKP